MTTAEEKSLGLIGTFGVQDKVILETIFGDNNVSIIYKKLKAKTSYVQMIPNNLSNYDDEINSRI